MIRYGAGWLLSLTLGAWLLPGAGYPQNPSEQTLTLELLEEQRFASGFVFLRYAVGTIRDGRRDYS